MKNFIETIKAAIFWSKGWDILISLYNNIPMEKDAKPSKAFRILCGYVATLGLISIVSNIFPFTFNIYNSLNLFNSIIFMLYNVLPLVILFSLVGYMAVWLKNKSFSVAIAFFIQGIKFFFVASIVVGLLMLIGANELFVNNINIMDKKQFNAVSQKSYM